MEDERARKEWERFYRKAERKLDATLNDGFMAAIKQLDFQRLVENNPALLKVLQGLNTPGVAESYLKKMPSSVQEKFVMWHVSMYCETKDEISGVKKVRNRRRPEWVQKLEVELASQYAPTAQLKKIVAGKREFSPAELAGAVMGHEVAAFHPDNQSFEKILQDASIGSEAREFLQTMVDATRGLRLELVDDARRKAEELSFDETKKFTAGFAKALEKGTFTEVGELVGATSGIKAYFAIWLFWPFVAELESVTELYDWLRVQLKWPDDEGHFKFVEKVCQRVGLRFRGRGRPKGAKIPQPHKNSSEYLKS